MKYIPIDLPNNRTILINPLVIRYKVIMRLFQIFSAVARTPRLEQIRSRDINTTSCRPSISLNIPTKQLK